MKLKHHLLAALACLLWSSAFAGIKIALNYMDPLPLAGLRFFAAGLVLSPFLFREKNKRALLKWALPLGLLQTALQYGTFTYGMSMVDGAVGAIIVGTSPLAAVLMSHLFFHDDKMDRTKGLTILFGISGVILLSLPKGFEPSYGSGYFLGIALLLICVAAASGGSIVVAKSRSSALNPFALNSAQFLSGGALLLVLAFFLTDKILLPQAVLFWGAFSWLVFLSTGAFSIWYFLLHQPGIKVSRLSFWKFLIPVFGALLSWIVLPGESPSLTGLLGIFFSGGSVFLFFYLSARETNAAHGDDQLPDAS